MNPLQFFKTQADVVPFKFETVTSDEYVCGYSLVTQKKFMDNIYNASKRQLAKKTGRSLPSDVDSYGIERFEVPLNMLKLVGVAISATQKDVERKVLKDGIKVLTAVVDRCFFIKNGDMWVIEVKVRGAYVLKQEAMRGDVVREGF